MTIIIGLAIAIVVITMVDITAQKIVFNTVDGLVITMIIEEIKTIIDNRE